MPRGRLGPALECQSESSCRLPGHKSVEMVLRYVRVANQFKENAVNALGL